MKMRDKHKDFTDIEICKGNRYNVLRGKFYCCLNGKTYNSLGGLRNGIRPYFATVKEFYDTYYKTPDEGICVVCGKEAIFKNVVRGYSRVCSDICHCKDPLHRQKVSTRFENNPAKLEAALLKQRQTMSAKPQEWKDRRKHKQLATLYSRHGRDYLSKRTTQQWTKLSQEQRKEIGQRSVRTKIKNGTLNVNGMANYKKKSFTLDNKTFCYQGYERFVIECLVTKFGFSVDDIFVGKDVPRIEYSGNKSGVYYPDIFVKSLNLVIEVKSEFTLFGKDESVFIKNCNKQQSVIDSGYNAVIICLYNGLVEEDVAEIEKHISMVTSSRASETKKVQRLSGGSEYSAIAIGRGSTKVPKYWDVI